MTNTPFSNKCRILHDFYFAYRDDEDWSDFFRNYDLGLPVATAFVMGGIALEPRAYHWIDETFTALISALDKNIDAEYVDLNDVMEIFDE